MFLKSEAMRTVCKKSSSAQKLLEKYFLIKSFFDSKYFAKPSVIENQFAPPVGDDTRLFKAVYPKPPLKSKQKVVRLFIKIVLPSRLFVKGVVKACPLGGWRDAG